MHAERDQQREAKQPCSLYPFQDGTPQPFERRTGSEHADKTELWQPLEHDGKWSSFCRS
jgi:hypothetical protein